MAIAMVTDGPAQKTKRGKGTQGRTKEAQKKRASETTSHEKRAPLKAETPVRENTAAEELANKLSTIVLADPELGYRAAVHLRRRGGSAELIKQSAWTRERRTSLAELFELTSGSLAIEQSLQLMAGRDLSREEYRRDKTVSVGTLPAPQLKPHDFKALLGEKTVSVPESASMIPHDAIAVRCASIKHAIRLSDLAKLFKQQAPFFVANVGHGDDFEKKLLAQFGLKTPGPLVRKFYGVAIDEMSVMVEDPYLVEGADMAVLFKLGNKFLFKERIGKYRESFKKQVSGAAEGSISYNGFTIHTLTSPNGELRAHTVEHGDYWIIASSAWMARRIIDTIQGKVRSISDNLDYRYLLSVHRGAGDAFVYIGDDFVSKIISARFKIGELRRVNCEANLRMIGFARNLYAIERRAAPVFADLSGAKYYLPELVCPEGGTYDMRDGVPRCSKHGSLGGLLPLSANPVEMVTEGEAQRYRQFVIITIIIGGSTSIPSAFGSISEKTSRCGRSSCPWLKIANTACCKRSWAARRFSSRPFQSPGKRSCFTRRASCAFSTGTGKTYRMWTMSACAPACSGFARSLGRRTQGSMSTPWRRSATSWIFSSLNGTFPSSYVGTCFVSTCAILSAFCSGMWWFE